MENKKVVFAAPWQVEVRTERDKPLLPAPGEVLVEKIYTLISPGTELACLSGGEAWFGFPGVPGYAAVSRVVAVGGGVDGWSAGQLVFHYGSHCQYECIPVTGVCLKVPDGLEPRLAVFARLTNVAMTAIRVSAIELGDYVSVAGLGLIGNLASQLATLQGAHVIGIDLSPQRLQLAERCAAAADTLPAGADTAERIAQLTAGAGVSTHIDATGVSGAAIDSLRWIGPLGELILLGSPRGRYEADVTEVLNYCHLYNRGCITFKGAHEWRYPIEPASHMKHSLVRNAGVAFRLLTSGKLQVEPLISHILKPERAAEAYEGLRHEPDRFTGVLFDWS